MKRDAAYKPTVEERLMERGLMKQVKLDMIKEHSEKQTTFKPCLNKNSLILILASKHKQNELPNNWGSGVKFEPVTPS